MKREVDLIVHGASQLLTMKPELAAGSSSEFDDIGLIERGAVAIHAGRIVEVGQDEQILDRYRSDSAIDATGQTVTPGFIDPHTHLVFAGSRHWEFAARMAGATYQEILAAGGGIHETVRATRGEPIENLVAQARGRLGEMVRLGVTTAEVKSGYGLDLDTELKLLRAIAELQWVQPIQLVPTYLGAHVVPAEYSQNRSGYLDLMMDRVLPKIAEEQLADACDVFLDDGAFTREEAEAILRRAMAHGLRPKIHAGQFSDQGGAELIASLKGLSADHLEHIGDAGIDAMAEAKVVANLLPGAAFSLRDRFPSGRRLIDRGVQVAVATDNNPGSSRTENLPLMGALAVTQMGLTVSEAVCAMTLNGARALGMAGEIGAIGAGMRADLTVLAVPDFRFLFYHFGMNHTAMVIIRGKMVYREARA